MWGWQTAAAPNAAFADFPDPFSLYSLLTAPVPFREILNFCQRIFLTSGSYRATMERVASYLVTDLEFPDASIDERKKWEDLLNRRLKVTTFLKEVVLDVFCYGNAFVSVIPVHHRWASCDGGCGLILPLRVILKSPKLKFQWKIPDLFVSCPSCRRVQKWTMHDWKRHDKESVALKRWPPQEIEIEYDPYTEHTSYLWDIPALYRSMLRKSHGNEFVLERADLNVIRAVAQNKLYRFHEDDIYHLRETRLAGVTTGGWGIPRTLLNYTQIFHSRALMRINEALAMDYLAPKRVVSPIPPSSGTGPVAAGFPPDQLRLQSSRDFLSMVYRAFASWRRDPTAIPIMPWPLQMQILGPDPSSATVPQQLLDHAQKTLASDSGAPLELFNGSLQVNAMPPALRLMENMFSHILHGLNDLLDWMCTKISQLQSWEKVTVKLRKLTLADSLERQMMAFNLLAQNMLSPSTALREMGYDHLQETKQKIEDMLVEMEAQDRMKKQVEQTELASQAFSAPPGAMPGVPPGAAPPDQSSTDQSQSMMPDQLSQLIAFSSHGPRSIEELESTAQALAAELMGVPDSIRLSKLRELRKANELLHSRVLELLRQNRQRVRSQAGNLALAQYQQSQGAMPPAGM